MESIPLEKIICESNRKYTKDDDFEQLLNSIGQYGIIQAPVVRRIDDDQFKVIAGRRRIEAARQLKLESVECQVREADVPVDDDEEIALTENVNRQEMHPLDEASAFKRMADGGNPVEEIARYYARSKAAIYKRLRLCGLTEKLKGMFRDGLLNIAEAAVLAELPEDDQDDFFDIYGKKESEIEHGVIYQFINKKQRYVIKKCMQGCEECNKRTHNENNELFSEFQHLSDVCLNAECYRAKWYEMLEARMKEQEIQFNEAGLKTDDKILFRGEPLNLLYKKASYVNIKDSYGLQIKHEILREKDYEFTGETNRKKDACWMVRADVEGNITIQRLGYKAKPQKEKSETNSGSGTSTNKIDYAYGIKDFGKEAIEAAAAERGTTTKELAEQLYGKKMTGWDFKNEIDDLVKERVIKRRIEAAWNSSEPTVDYLSFYLQKLDDYVGYSGGTLNEEKFNDIQKNWLEDLIGSSLSLFSINLSNEVQQLFHFLILCTGFEDDAPLPEELKDIEKEDNNFWRYANMSKDEYRAMYLEAAKEVTARALDQKEKKSGKKKGGKKAAAAEEPDMETSDEGDEE